MALMRRIQERRDVRQQAERKVLERAYPLAKQLAEVLELEAIEPAATRARELRWDIGARLAALGGKQ